MSAKANLFDAHHLSLGMPLETQLRLSAMLASCEGYRSAKPKAKRLMERLLRLAYADGRNDALSAIGRAVRHAR